MNDQTFAGKVALVTGGASGIGEACVLTLARGGARVAIVDLNGELGDQTVAAVQQAGGEAIFLRVDVSDPVAVEQMVAATVERSARGRAHGRGAGRGRAGGVFVLGSGVLPDRRLLSGQWRLHRAVGNAHA